jgi:hypothetical protein
MVSFVDDVRVRGWLTLAGSDVRSRRAPFEENANEIYCGKTTTEPGGVTKHSRV